MAGLVETCASRIADNRLTLGLPYGDQMAFRLQFAPNYTSSMTKYQFIEGRAQIVGRDIEPVRTLENGLAIMQPYDLRLPPDLTCRQLDRKVCPKETCVFEKKRFGQEEIDLYSRETGIFSLSVQPAQKRRSANEYFDGGEKLGSVNYGMFAFPEEKPGELYWTSDLSAGLVAATKRTPELVIDFLSLTMNFAVFEWAMGLTEPQTAEDLVNNSPEDLALFPLTDKTSMLAARTWWKNDSYVTTRDEHTGKFWFIWIWDKDKRENKEYPDIYSVLVKSGLNFGIGVKPDCERPGQRYSPKQYMRSRPVISEGRIVEGHFVSEISPEESE